MDTGRDFLQAQLNNCIAQHQSLVVNLRDHLEQADDPRYKQLCAKYLPKVERHQGMLEEYGKSMGADAGGGVKGAIGSMLGKARDVVDSMRETDFLRVVGDIVMIRQAQDTFATFARVGERLGEQRLAEIGRMGEQEHDEMQRDFNAFCVESFVDHVKGTVAEKGQRSASSTRAIM